MRGDVISGPGDNCAISSSDLTFVAGAKVGMIRFLNLKERNKVMKKLLINWGLVSIKEKARMLNGSTPRSRTIRAL